MVGVTHLASPPIAALPLSQGENHVSAVQSQRQPHGVPHQLNIYVKDRESTITARGKHKRCLVFGVSSATQVQVRVDDVPGDGDLPWPSVDQVVAAAHHPHHRMHGRGTRLEFAQLEEEESSYRGPLKGSRWYNFNVVAR